MADNIAEFLNPGPTVESDDAGVVALARRAAGDAASPKAQAIRLYYAIRDEIITVAS